MTDTTGQPSEGTEATQTTGAGTEGEATPAQTTTAGTAAEEETFFDPKDLSDELKPAYKLMQRAFSEKTSALKANKPKIDAYDRFMANPIATIQQLGAQYGLHISTQQANQIAQNVASPDQNWEPKTWQDVLDKAKETVLPQARQEVLKELNPLINEVKQTKKIQVEKMLDENCPDWKLYEDDMMKNLETHPSLVNDPIKLYRLSVPEDVLIARATKAALKKMEDKVKGSQVSGGSNTTKPGDSSPTKARNFDEAVVMAKQILSKQSA
jgi:hypothetical protein